MNEISLYELGVWFLVAVAIVCAVLLIKITKKGFDE